MTLTVELKDSVAIRLNSKASACQLSAEEFAAQLLNEAVGQLEKDEQQQNVNERRLSLIRRCAVGDLSGSELAELQRLQDAVDRQLESVDDDLLAQLARMCSQAEQGGP